MKKIVLLAILLLFQSINRLEAQNQFGALGSDNTWTGIQTFSVAPVFDVPPVLGGFTPCAVIFAGSSGELAESAATFCWDNTLKRLGLGTSSPGARLEVVAPASAGVVGAIFKGNNTAAADVVRIYNSASTPLLKSYFDSTGAFNTALQMTSSLSTGTAAFSIASTTKISNLNADLLDDLTSADFARATVSTTYSGTTTQNFGASGTTLVMPKKSTPVSPTAAEVWITTGSFLFRDNAGSPATHTLADLDSAQTLSSKTLASPTIANFTNATHAHTSNSTGGLLTTSAIGSGIFGSTRGGTGNGFTKFTGPTSSEKTFTLPNTDAAILTDDTEITPAQGGTGASNTATSGRYLKGDGTDFVTSSGSASGVGACASSRWVSTLSSDAAPTCTQPASTDMSDTTNIVRKNAANAWSTGAQDMGSATSFKVPTGAGAAPTANGLIAYDSTANQYKGGVNTAANYLVQAAAALTSGQLVQGAGNGAVATTGTYTVQTAASAGVTVYNAGTATSVSRSDHQHWPAAIVSTSAVTVNAATNGDQNLISLTIPAAALNSTGRTVQVFGGGTYTTDSSGAGTMTYKLKLCTVAGCGSGTVITLGTFGPTAAQSASATSMPWNTTASLTTVSTGASGTVILNGSLATVLSTTATADGIIHLAQTTGASSAVDLTGALYLQWTVADSGSSANNAFTQRQAVASAVN